MVPGHRSAAPTAATLSGAVGAGKVIGPSFAADEVPDVIEALIETYRDAARGAGERFIDTVRRVGIEPFKQAANARAPRNRRRRA